MVSSAFQNNQLARLVSSAFQNNQLSLASQGQSKSTHNARTTASSEGIAHLEPFWSATRVKQCRCPPQRHSSATVLQDLSHIDTSMMTPHACLLLFSHVCVRMRRACYLFHWPWRQLPVVRTQKYPANRRWSRESRQINSERHQLRAARGWELQNGSSCWPAPNYRTSTPRARACPLTYQLCAKFARRAPATAAMGTVLLAAPIAMAVVVGAVYRQSKSPTHRSKEPQRV